MPSWQVLQNPLIANSRVVTASQLSISSWVICRPQPMGIHRFDLIDSVRFDSPSKKDAIAGLFFVGFIFFSLFSRKDWGRCHFEWTIQDPNPQGLNPSVIVEILAECNFHFFSLFLWYTLDPFNIPQHRKYTIGNMIFYIYIFFLLWGFYPLTGSLCSPLFLPAYLYTNAYSFTMLCIRSPYCSPVHFLTNPLATIIIDLASLGLSKKK